MFDWFLMLLGGWQRSAVTGLAAELRAGGAFAAILAFALGALHALTPGHGKAALAAYFLGKQAQIATGVRVTLGAAFLHVLMGFAAFLMLRFVVAQTPFMAPRGSPAFSLIGYGLVALAGIIMLVQSLRPSTLGMHPHVLTLGVGLLPCPLTIMVLGFAWTQSTTAMVVIVLLSLACGIALTIGTVALSAILARRFFDEAFLGNMLRLERPARYVQGAAAIVVICVAFYSMWRSV